MKGLVLAGGQSTRMKCDKAELVVDGKPLFARAIDVLKLAGIDAYVSARRNSHFLDQLEVPVLFDDVKNIGPAAALLRGCRESPLDDWFVLACDLPNVTAEAVRILIDRHLNNDSAEITCFAHADGTPEPLFAIWSPTALSRLRGNVKNGFWGPMHTLNECEVQLIAPTTKHLLFNTNTPQQWMQFQDYSST